MNVIIGIRGSVHVKISTRSAIFVSALIYVLMFVLITSIVSMSICW